MRQKYAAYEFHLVVQALQLYCSEELGGRYLDILKDRLYTTAADSAGRRSAQTALTIIRDGLIKLMAPILSFTAEEAWRIVHPGDPTIFAATWGAERRAVRSDSPGFSKRWTAIMDVRDAVLKRLESSRERAEIGSSLQAEIAITAPAPVYEALSSIGDDLRFVMITSSATVRRGDALDIQVMPSAHVKCERCWHYRADVGADPTHSTLCGRCVANLYGSGEPRRFA
jgi:isoleucyl-tRNA synthetase